MNINDIKSEFLFNNAIINQLYNKALESKIDQQLAAGIIKSSKMISKAYCNSPCNILNGLKISSLHAETHAIIKYFGKSFYFDKNKGFVYSNEKKNKKIDLIVIRINKSGNPCNARPCYNCLNLMKAVGIRKVYYSINMINNTNKDYLSIKLVCENVQDMVSIQTSSISRCLDINQNFIFSSNCEDIYETGCSNTNVSRTKIDLYYENLLKKMFPAIIKKYNLDLFIEYNLIRILPNYKIKIINGKYLWILNSNNIKIIEAIIK